MHKTCLHIHPVIENTHSRKLVFKVFSKEYVFSILPPKHLFSYPTNKEAPGRYRRRSNPTLLTTLKTCNPNKGIQQMHPEYIELNVLVRKIQKFCHS